MRLGAYRTLVDLGRGGMADLYVARGEPALPDAPLIIVKTLRPPVTEKRIEMFKQDPDAERAVAFIRERFGESAVVFDGRYNLTVTDLPSAWSAFHGPANFVYLPPAMRRQFLSNTAQTLRRAGWVVVRRHAPANASGPDQNKVRLFDPEGLLQDIYHVYRPTQGLDFGNYHAIRFESR